MEIFSEYLSAISDQDHRDRMEEVLLWVRTAFPSLKRKRLTIDVLTDRNK